MLRRTFLGLGLSGIAGAAFAESRDPLDRFNGNGPLRFRNAEGGAFRPVRLVLVTDQGNFGAPLPEAAEIQSEDRLDLSSVPLVGEVFRGTLAPSDARQGVLVGDVQRVGDMLVVRAAGFPEGLVRASVVVSTSVPQLGPVSYAVGRLPYRDASLPAAGEIIGSAHLVGSQLVIASRGGEPAYPSVESLVEDLFN